MVTVTFQGASGRNLDIAPFGFDPIGDNETGDPFRVRHLITKLVVETLRDFHLREGARSFAVLTTEKIAEGLTKGRFGSAREEAQKVDVDQAIGQALQAFEDGLFLLFVDEIEKRDLEELVVLKIDSQVTIIRLVALAGA
jgi:hypothetical protein